MPSKYIETQLRHILFHYYQGKDTDMRLTRKIAPFLIASLIILGVTSQITGASNAPSGVPVSGLEQFVDEYAANHIGTDTAGAVVAIVKDGEVIFNKAYGWAVMDEVKAETDSVFEWGSATKLLVWTSAMQLAEQGKLDLNADVRQYLPDGFLRKLVYDADITMYNLMHHNAGWEDRFFDLFYNSTEAVPNLGECLLAFEPAQLYEPGTFVAYSNYGTALAGYIVERISGQPFYEYVWENIFDPLGMKNTSIHPTQADNPSIAERRAQIKGHTLAKGRPAPSPTERVYVGLYPAGSAIGTAEDATRFIAALMPSEGEKCVLFNNSGTLDEMLSVSHKYSEYYTGIAHGFWEFFYSVRALGHGGNTDSFSANFAFAPEARFGVIILTNQAGEMPMCHGLTKELFGAYEPPGDPGLLPDARILDGLYTMTRKTDTGFVKLIGVLGLIPVASVDENTLLIAGAVEFKQISPYVFQNTGNSNALDIFDLIYFNVDNGKVIHASVMSSDLVPMSALDMVTVFGSAILVVLCALYVLAALIVTIIGSIRNKKRGVASNPAKKLNISLYLSMAAIFANNAILLLRALSYDTYASLKVHFVINIAFMVFVPLCIGFMLVNKKKDASKGSKVFNTFTCVCSVILAAFLIGWEFWR